VALATVHQWGMLSGFNRTRWPTKFFCFFVFVLRVEHLAEYLRAHCQMVKEMNSNDLPNSEQKEFYLWKANILKVVSHGYLNGETESTVVAHESSECV
jgi:hypothetical protein